jgi:hypothetical protein
VKRLLLVAASCLLLFGCEAGCALGVGGVRHVATVTSSGSGSALDLIQDTELRIVCGRLNAPAPPLCVSDDPPADGSHSLHFRIHEKLTQAFGLHKQMTDLVTAVPDTSEGQSIQATKVLALVAQISALVNEILGMIPDGSPQKANVVLRLKAA